MQGPHYLNISLSEAREKCSHLMACKQTWLLGLSPGCGLWFWCFEENVFLVDHTQDEFRFWVPHQALLMAEFAVCCDPNFLILLALKCMLRYACQWHIGIVGGTTRWRLDSSHMPSTDCEGHKRSFQYRANVFRRDEANVKQRSADRASWKWRPWSQYKDKDWTRKVNV